MTDLKMPWYTPRDYELDEDELKEVILAYKDNIYTVLQEMPNKVDVMVVIDVTRYGFTLFGDKRTIIASQCEDETNKAHILAKKPRSGYLFIYLLLPAVNDAYAVYMVEIPLHLFEQEVN